MYSVPPGQRWDEAFEVLVSQKRESFEQISEIGIGWSSKQFSEVIKVTCFPWWATLFPPAMGVADIQPRRFMPTEVAFSARLVLCPVNAHECPVYVIAFLISTSKLGHCTLPLAISKATAPWMNREAHRDRIFQVFRCPAFDDNYHLREQAHKSTCVRSIIKQIMILSAAHHLFLFRIKQGYEDAKEQHQQLVARGLRPLPNAPLTPWSDAQFCEMRKPKCPGGHSSFSYEKQCLGQNGRVYLQASMRRICHLWAHSNLVLVILFLKTHTAMDHPSFEDVGPIVKIGIFHCHLLFLGMYLMYLYY